MHVRRADGRELPALVDVGPEAQADCLLGRSLGQSRRPARVQGKGVPAHAEDREEARVEARAEAQEDREAQQGAEGEAAREAEGAEGAQEAKQE